MEHLDSTPPVFVARQPVVDACGELFAYELLFRTATGTTAGTLFDGSVMTGQILADVATNGLQSLTRGVPAFINFPPELLVTGAAGMLTPAESFVIEVLETTPPDTNVLEECSRLRKAGLRIALDDVVTAARLTAFAGSVDIVKVDILGAEAAEIPAILEVARALNIRTLAEKIETARQMDETHALGFDLFQGFLVGRPARMRRRSMPGIPGHHLRLLEATSKPMIDLDELEEVVLSDPTLTYKVLAYANSAHAAQRREIRSVRDAIVLVGQDEIRRAGWIVVFAALSTTAPSYLLHESLSCAYFSDFIARACRLTSPSECFLAGLLSNADALLGVPLDEAICRLPLADDLKSAIITGEGPVGTAVGLATDYGAGRWPQAITTAESIGVDQTALPALYEDASSRSARMLAHVVN